MSKHELVGYLLGVWALTTLGGCKSPPQNVVEPAPTRATPEAKAPEIKAPDESTIPSGPLGEAVRRGKQLVTRTKEELPDHVGNGLHCTSCHLDGGARAGAAPWIGLVGMFPEYRARSGTVNTLERRVNDCFERSMNGKALDPVGAEMSAIVAYMTWLSRDVPVGKELAGRGFKRIQPAPKADPVHGKEVYAARCASCHGQDGGGIAGPDGAYLFPALWGDRSFNLGAGMARLETAAAFVKANMPLGQGNTLTDQEAYDVADWFIHQPRPDFAAKAGDWPKGGKPADARY